MWELRGAKETIRDYMKEEYLRDIGRKIGGVARLGKRKILEQ
jgi:hypothetical protein